MRILMIGNSLTYWNEMYNMVASNLDAEVIQNTRANAYLDMHHDKNDELGQRTLSLLENEKFDYVVIQESSNTPFTERERYSKSLKILCDLVHKNGAKPVIYASWAYEKDGKYLSYFDFSYDEMYKGMCEACHEEGMANNALIADVGIAFYEKCNEIQLYDNDGLHPSLEGSKLAAKIISETILKDSKK